MGYSLTVSKTVAIVRGSERLRGSEIRGGNMTRVADGPRIDDVTLAVSATGAASVTRVADGSRIDVVIPALDEEAAVGQVVEAVLRTGVREVVVVDNGSTDGTAAAARAAGARVVYEARRGYGSACLAGIASLQPDGDVVVFLDADWSDDPAMLPVIVEPITDGEADFVVGSRALGAAEPGALTLPQRLGNAIAARWLRLRFGLPATDLGPFRAIARPALERLGMRDRGYGWTVEMQIKAARAGLRYREVPVPYRRRIGRSKISGTVRGVLGASWKIIGLLIRYDLWEGRPRRSRGDAPRQPSEIA